MIFDTHAHYDSDSFKGNLDKIVEELKNAGVIGVLNCGSSIKGARDSVEFAKKYDIFYAAVGIHPEDANTFNEEVFIELKNLVKEEKVQAIGEIGLDYYWDENPSKEVQKKVFRKQMELAKEVNLPVVIHDREAHLDTIEIIKEFKEVCGVLHCFSGSVEFARECIKEGYYIGIGGVLTFKNAKKLVEVAKEIPLRSIIIETDAPYMAPEPFRGKTNRSDYLEYVIEKLAKVKEINKEDLEKILIQNSKKFLNIL